MASNRFEILLQKWVTGKISAGEADELLSMLKDDNADETVQAAFDKHFAGFDGDVTSLQQRQAALTKMQAATMVPKTKNRTFFMRYWWAAATVAVVVSAGLFFWSDNRKLTTPVGGNSSVAAHILPGQDGAILTLADGSKVVLDSLKNGVVTMQNGVSVTLNNGQLTYEYKGTGAPESMYNTVTTPNGRQFSVVLPDGTRVWLNAASSLHYPMVFGATERVVEVEGEAYFEVAKNAKSPFRVKVAGKMDVVVLGTSFNVNAYANEEKINTTLVEGAVRVDAGRHQRALHPGQQARLAVGATTEITVVNADIDKAIAWKNGTFNFNNTGLSDAMKQLERWYNIEVMYENGIPDIHLVGEMSRDITFNDLLSTLEDLGVHYRLDGRKLVVLRKHGSTALPNESTK